jgi:hypothetical protein
MRLAVVSAEIKVFRLAGAAGTLDAPPGFHDNPREGEGMTTGTAYRIENLEVYRKTIAFGTRLYQEAGNGKAHSAVGERVRENTLALVLNLASGLGFWEKQWKTSHFAASKRALMELTPLLELMVALGEMTAETEAQYAGELQEVARMVSGLLRQAQRREGGGEEPGPPREGDARERPTFYH